MRGIKRWVWWLLAWRMFGPAPRPKFRAPQGHPWPLPGRSVFVGEHEIVVRETGAEKGDPVLLIHGLGGSSTGEWYLVGKTLASSHHLIMIDARSHGLSPDYRERYEVDDLADDIRGVLDQLGVGPVTAVGFSMGGAVAQVLARRHAEVVSRLVLIAAFAHHPPGAIAWRRVGALVARAWERLTGTGTPEVRGGYLLAVGAVEPRYSRWLWDETHRRDPDAGAQATFAALRFDSRDWIGSLDVEALVIIPTGDFLVPPSWQRELASLMPNSKVVEIAGARHEVVWTHADDVSREIEAFLAQSS